MKILHLFSDWKWTGPSEPILNLCKALERRGHEVILAYRRPPVPVEDSLERRVRENGIFATDKFHLNRPLRLYSFRSIRDNLSDVFDLTDYLRSEKIEVLNVHQSHDHLLGGMAARRAGGPVVVIRTDHKRDAIPSHIGNRLLISKFTDGLITFSETGREKVERHFGFPKERICKANPALDLERFRTRIAGKDMRAHFGIGEEEIVIGMVARFQKYRRTEVFLEAIKQIVPEYPKIKVLLVGRSSQMEESVLKPMKRLGVEPWVVLGGYQTDHYLDTLACMDLFVFLMPGSDGTARALREAMAMGKPSIVANRGILPELIDHGVTGLVVEDTPENLAMATLQLLKAPELRSKMGQAAREKAQREFRLDRQAEVVEGFYQEVMKLGRWRGK
ncbi:MAG: glycosyltransferase family 4 protein [Desulfobacterota bacterium]|nr:glycosyltransferase family 4 protein [Thermodesulfobacteriota bacterium]